MRFGEEKHSRVNWLRDVILGGQDGLVNVLGIVLGVSTASSNNKILMTASLAAAFAESISMAAVAYTSTLADRDYYEKELKRELEEVNQAPEKEREEIRQIYERKGFAGKILEEVVEIITQNKKVWLNTMMEDELGLKRVEKNAILRTSIVVGFAALVGSFVPIMPFVFLPLPWSVVMSLFVSGVVLFGIGVYEAKTYVGHWIKNGFQMLVIGLGSALAGFLVGKIFR